MRPIAIPLGAAVVVALAACQTAPAAPAATTAVPSAPPAAPAAPSTDTEQAVANLAIEALAAELKIPADGIEVESVRAVDWPDSSLGCPQPDRAYLQVVTPGHAITLRAGGAVHVVHEANNRAFVCRQPQAGAAASPAGGELGFARQLQLARRDLAGRLNVAESEVRMIAATPVTFDDASLDCPEPGAQYAQVETEGWVMTLRHGGREYAYHADAQRAIPCPRITAE